MLVASTGCSGLSSAQSVSLQDIFGAEAESRCWSRTYSRDHLAGKPRQRVVSIRIDSFYWPQRMSAEIPTNENPLERYRRVKQTTIEFRLRDGEESGKEIYCSSAGGRLACGLENDGGSVTVAAQPGGRLRVDAGDRMAFETSRKFVDLARSDDRTFILDPLPSASCRRPPR